MTVAELIEKLRADAAALLTDDVWKDVAIAMALLGHPMPARIQASIDAFNEARFLSAFAQQLEALPKAPVIHATPQ